MWPDPQETADLVTFPEEIVNGKPHFFCSVTVSIFEYNSIVDAWQGWKYASVYC